MELRRLEEGDFSALIALIKEVYGEIKEAMWFENEPEQITLRTMLEYKFALVNEGRAVSIVAVENKIVIGEMEIIKENEIGKVGIIIKKEYRRKGLGKELFEKAEREAKKIGIEFLIAEISKENKTAQLFFLNSGFIPTDKEIEGKIVIYEKRI